MVSARCALRCIAERSVVRRPARDDRAVGVHPEERVLGLGAVRVERSKAKEPDPELTEEERMKLRLEEHDRQDLEQNNEEGEEEEVKEPQAASVKADDGKKKD